MLKNAITTCLVVTLIIIIQSCKKDEDEATSIDSDLFNESSSTTGFTYYLGTPGITSGVGNSPHGFERVRFNSIAQATLDSTGKLSPGNSFPAGSIIVKEVYSTSLGGLNLYAIMKKEPGNNNAGSGYLWAEFNADGSVAYSTSKKGDGCISCHSLSGNRDLVRTFDLH